MTTMSQVGSDALSLGHVPAGPWQFDESVTNVFSDMLKRSIPQYEVMRRTVFDIGMRHAKPDTAVVDLGCSRGDALAPFVESLGSLNRYVGVEVAPPMLSAARDRFSQQIATGLVTIRSLDLREDYPAAEASVTLCVLTLQFIPLEHRQRVLHDAYANTQPGGAFVLVEKVLGSTSGLNAMMVDVYYSRKREAGYTEEEVQRKKLALEGVLMPVTAQWNAQLLRDAGFREVDCFWRWMNFAGWVAIK
jgi:tRNA (cmo5U34)-methyltransferase